MSALRISCASIRPISDSRDRDSMPIDPPRQRLPGRSVLQLTEAVSVQKVHAKSRRQGAAARAWPTRCGARPKLNLCPAYGESSVAQGSVVDPGLFTNRASDLSRSPFVTTTAERSNEDDMRTYFLVFFLPASSPPRAVNGRQAPNSRRRASVAYHRFIDLRRCSSCVLQFHARLQSASVRARG
jgi:hypothetical protein